MRAGDQTMTVKVHSLLTAGAAALLSTVLLATSALAGQAKKPAAKPAEKPAAAAQAAPAAPAAPARFVPPIRGEAPVQMTKPVVKRTGNEVVENFKVKNASANGSIAGLKISEFWYDKDGNPVSGDEFRYRKPLLPGEVIDVELRSPINPKMQRSQYKFEQANGTVKPTQVAKLQ
jgi:hypothetical protein